MYGQVGNQVVDGRNAGLPCTMYGQFGDRTVYGRYKNRMVDDKRLENCMAIFMIRKSIQIKLWKSC